MTIYDIAKKAGVSASTVSRIINHRGGASEATVRKVEEILRENHYCLNEAARGLVMQASRIIGILMMDIRLSHHAEDVYSIERELEKLGYCCIIMNTGKDDAAKARYIRILSQRRVEGAVLIGSGFQCDEVKKAIMEYMPRIPVVISNGKLDLSNVYGVLADDQNGIASCVAYLAQKGRKNQVLLDDGVTPSSLFKRMGYEQAMRVYCESQESRIIHSQSGTAGAYEATKKLLEEYPQTDAIIFAVDSLMAGGMRALHEKNIRIPDRLSVICTGNQLYSEVYGLKMTTLDSRSDDMRVSVAQNLISALSGKKVPKNMIVVSAIIEGETA